MLLATVLLLFQTTAPSVAASSSIPPISRFQMIGDGAYRGGQPDRLGFEYLKKSGIKTVINLRTDNGEEAIVKELGMNYIHIPVSLKSLVEDTG
jgi:protein tyrosine phosphatase (PTP) superfamily phosphohydrolase (DUF442 family)